LEEKRSGKKNPTCGKGGGIKRIGAEGEGFATTES